MEAATWRAKGRQISLTNTNEIWLPFNLLFILFYVCAGRHTMRRNVCVRGNFAWSLNHNMASTTLDRSQQELIIPSFPPGRNDLSLVFRSHSLSLKTCREITYWKRHSLFSVVLLDSKSPSGSPSGMFPFIIFLFLLSL
jgi:hypothetical protein